jgi:hypothetical protein
MNEEKIDGILSQARAAMEPTNEDRERVRKKVIAAIATAGVTTAVATTAANASSASGAGTWGALSSLPSSVKLTAAVLLMGGVASLAVLVMLEEDVTPAEAVSLETDGQHRRPARTKATAVSESHIPESITKPAEESPAAVEPTPAPAEETMPPAGKNTGKKSRQAAVASSAHPEEEASDSTLFKEIALIKKASASLRDNRPAEAAHILSRYDREIEDGIMGEERAGLGVLVLCAQGRRAEALRARDRFLKRSPSSPLAVRIRETCRVLEEDNE